MRSLKFAIAATLLLGLQAFAQQHTLSSGTSINVRTDSGLNAQAPPLPRVFPPRSRMT